MPSRIINDDAEFPAVLAQSLYERQEFLAVYSFAYFRHNALLEEGSENAQFLVRVVDDFLNRPRSDCVPPLCEIRN